jgi:thiol-disulfide isomerase/thioredoxin
MSFDNTGIVFLERSDFNGNKLHKSGKSGKWFIMVQASFCGWCTKAKPAFIKAKDQVGDRIVFATIHADSENESEVALAREFGSISNFDIKGIPAFFLYDPSTGVFTKYSGQNTEAGFLEFLAKH